MEDGPYMYSLPDEYMEQEEEWEREGLLDPAWEKQQRKVRKITGIVHQLLSFLTHLTTQ